MKTQTFTQPADIETLSIDAPAANVRVIASDATTTATLEISGPHEEVDAARVGRSGSLWSATMPEPHLPSADGTSTVVNTVNGITFRGSGTTVFQGGDIHGSISFSGGMGTVQPAEPVTITARVPRGIRVSVTTETGNIRISGWCREVSAWTTSGSVHVADAGSVQVSSVSGGITVAHADATVGADSVSGDVNVRGGTDIDLRSVSGDIGYTSTRTCRVSARTTSGDIILARLHQMQAQVSSVSGDISG